MLGVRLRTTQVSVDAQDERRRGVGSRPGRRCDLLVDTASSSAVKAINSYSLQT